MTYLEGVNGARKTVSVHVLFLPALSQFLLPLIIEKLDSDVQSAKLDSLQTLVRNSSEICDSFVLCRRMLGCEEVRVGTAVCQLIFG